jgi:MFS-type transporter involved in bile tolerance (Atg22 family)
MLIMTNIGVLLLAMIVGKRSERLGWKQYLAVGFLTLVQTAVAAYYMFHMEKPPLF